MNNIKCFKSPGYNFLFDRETGFFLRWGKTKEDDPEYSPFSPELIDIEISSGYCNGGCSFCYKSNTPKKEIKYMNIETYKKLFEKIKSPCLTQIAFGITSMKANPDMWDIFRYTRENDVIPNYTTNGIEVTEEEVKLTKELCGAVAISVYPHNKKQAYEAIRRYIDSKMDQVNIHFMLSKETLLFAYEVLKDIENNPLLKGLHAIVFLQYKNKNPDSHFTQPSFEEFKFLVDYCIGKEIPFGFDSCSSAMFMKSVMDRDNSDQLIQSVDNCESSLFSFFIDYTGYGYPCSFLQGVGEWSEGIDVLNCKNFVKDVWNSDRVVEYRNKLLNSSKNCKCKFNGSCRSCFVYDVNDCKRREV